MLRISEEVLRLAERKEEATLLSEEMLHRSETWSDADVAILSTRAAEGRIFSGQYGLAFSYLEKCGKKCLGTVESQMETQMAAIEIVRVSAEEEQDSRAQMSRAVLLKSEMSKTLEREDLSRLAVALAPRNTKPEMILALIHTMMPTMQTDDDASLFTVWTNELSEIIQEEYEARKLSSETLSLQIRLKYAQSLMSSISFSSETKEDDQKDEVDEVSLKSNHQHVINIITLVLSDVGEIDASLFPYLNAKNKNDEINDDGNAFFNKYMQVIRTRASVRTDALRLLLSIHTRQKQYKTVLDTMNQQQPAFVALDMTLSKYALHAAIEISELTVGSSYLKTSIHAATTANNIKETNIILALGNRLGHLYLDNGYIQQAEDILHGLFLSSEFSRFGRSSQSSTSNWNVFHARVLHAQGKYQEALDILQPMSNAPETIDGKASEWKLNSTTTLSTMGRYMLGRCHRDVGESTKAAYHFRLCMLHNMEKNGNSESDVVEEIEIFKSVVKMKNIGEIAFQLGSSLLESSRHGESLNYLLLAKSKRPRHSATLNNLGVLQFKMGRVQEARRTMKRALSINDGCTNRMNLGILLQEHTRSWRSAATQYKEAITRCGYQTITEKKNKDAATDVGAGAADAAGAAGAADNDQDQIQPEHDGITSIHSEADVVVLYSRLAKVLEQGSQLPDALSLLRSTLQLLNDRSIHQQTSLFVTHDSEQKMEWRNKWKSTNITMSNILLQTSSLLSSMGEHTEAIEVALRGRKMIVVLYGNELDANGKPQEHLQSLIDVGNAYLHAGHLTTAKTWYKRVLESVPNHSTGMNNYAATCYRLGENEQAEKIFIQMLKHNPRDRRAMEGIQMINKGKKKKLKGWNLWGDYE